MKREGQARYKREREIREIKEVEREGERRKGRERLREREVRGSKGR